MIAGLVRGGALALDVRQRAVQQDEPARTLLVADAVEPLLAILREAPAHRLLVAREDVDRERGRGDEQAMHRRLVVDRQQYQRRLERHRREAVGGHAVGTPVGIARGDHGDTGGEPAEQLAELCLVDGVLGHRTIRARKKGLRTGTGRQHGTGDAHERVGHAAPPADARDGVIEEPGHRHRVADEPLHRPLAGEAPPPRAAIVGEARDRWRDRSPRAPAMRLRHQFATRQRRADPFAGERVEEIGGVAHQQGARGGDVACARREWSGDEHLAHDALRPAPGRARRESGPAPP